MAAPRLLRTLSEHRALQCTRPFDEVHRALIDPVPAQKPEMSEILVRGQKERVAIARRDWPRLWLFLVRNHGELTVADGQGAGGRAADAASGTSNHSYPRQGP
jgi:hypothetical protein